MYQTDSTTLANLAPVKRKLNPVYGIDEQLNCGTITYKTHNKIFLVDMVDRDKFLNSRISFVFLENDLYPSFSRNYQRVSILKFLYYCDDDLTHCTFKNNNPMDLRRCNVQMFHFFHETIAKQYETILEYIPGHILNVGQDANIMKNPKWIVKENVSYKEIIVMYCEKDTICKLCPDSLRIIKEFEKEQGRCITWFKGQNGYILGTTPDRKMIYIHQVIANCYGNGKGTKTISVDHIDQNPLNNSLENLRIATREEQEQNCNGIKEGTKRQRKSSAKPLPEGITQEKMKKYVVYYHEWLDKEHTKQREYFKVETHPKLDGKPWIGSKSGKIPILEKLAEANKVVEDLENDIFPTDNSNNNSPALTNLPTYITITKVGEKTYLVYDEKEKEKEKDGLNIKQKRKNLKMVLPSNYDLQEQLVTFREKINAKYKD